MIPLNPFNLYKLQNKKDKYLIVLFSLMEPQKYLANDEIYFLGFSKVLSLQMFLFVMFLFVSVITLVGKGIIVLISRTDQTL